VERIYLHFCHHCDQDPEIEHCFDLSAHSVNQVAFALVAVELEPGLNYGLGRHDSNLSLLLAPESFALAPRIS